MYSQETIDRIRETVKTFGVDGASEKLNVSRETVTRALRNRADKEEDFTRDDSIIGKKLKNRYTENEIRLLLSGKGINPSAFSRPVLTFEGREVKIGFCTDLHIGEESFDDSLWLSFIGECARESVEHILISGDVHEGMSNRPDQIYHLSVPGSSNQMDHAEELFKMTDLPISMIDGNHDRWGIKSGGLFMVRDLANRFKDGRVQFIGSDCGDIVINGTVWRLWHGEDGSSYATSYRVQKLIEGFTGGDKPAVLLCGHTHKQGYFFDRNIHAVSGGALSYQSAWMKSTRKACHTGFWIISARIANNEIVKFTPSWYPIYR